jgi:putative endonuclease
MFDVTRVAGHTRSRSRNTVLRIFSFLDQKVRKALKLWMAQLEAEGAEWYLYMIRCHDGTLYTGISNDVTRRFEKHREMGKQGAKFLRGRGPLKLVFQKKIGSRSSALKMEQKIKKFSKSQKEIIIYKGDID